MDISKRSNKSKKFDEVVKIFDRYRMLKKDGLLDPSLEKMLNAFTICGQKFEWVHPSEENKD